MAIAMTIDRGSQRRKDVSGIGKMPRWVVSALIAVTLCKALVIFFFYQHVIFYDNGMPQVVRAFGWGELVSNMHQGKYEMVCQTGLPELDFTTRSGRPPIYAGMLYAATYWTPYPAAALVLMQSVITSLVAYLGYRIVRVSTNREGLAVLCLCVLFVFPMNFLKSGTIDEAPLMLVFLLTAVYLLGQHLRKPVNLGLLFLCGAMLGLSVMTRAQAKVVAYGLILYLLVQHLSVRNCKQVAILVFGYGCIISPWMIRNSLVHGVGTAGRLWLVTQSEDFIRSFPHESIDVIERRYLESFVESHSYLKQLDTAALNEEFKRLARKEAVDFPFKYLRAFATRLKTFVPYRYYPEMNSVPRDMLFVSWYVGALAVFMWSLVRRRLPKPENTILLISICAWILPGLLCFILSRHLYPVIVMMIIFSFVVSPRRNLHELDARLDIIMASQT